MSEWWDGAQAYERRYTERCIAENLEPFGELGRIHDYFFPDWRTRKKVMDWVAGKTCIEVGSSIHPCITELSQAKELIIVEPQAEVEAFASRMVLPENASLCACAGEDVLPGWKEMITGMVFSRNCIDHADHPLQLFDMILQCAAPKAWLLHWSDTWHYPHGDEGHRDITKEPKDIRKIVEGRGFHIHHEFTLRFLDERTIDYGCLARKIG